MPPLDPELARLRAEIDRIDDTLVDLLVERLAIVAQIAAAKRDRARGGLALRPGREASILRRLTARAADRFPTATLVRIWRELLAATTRAQTPLSVVVFAAVPELWDLARDQFGSVTPMRRAADAAAVLAELAAGRAAIGVLPMPTATDVWWAELPAGSDPGLGIVARLPFAPLRAGDAEALALARLRAEPSGDDLSLLLVEAEPGLEPVELRALAPAERAEPRRLGLLRRGGVDLHLVEVGGFHARGDLGLPAIRPARVLRVTSLGGYPRPLGGATSG